MCISAQNVQFETDLRRRKVKPVRIKFCPMLSIIELAAWLVYRSLAGGLSLIYAYSIDDVTTSWVMCSLWISQPGQLSLPSLRGRQMSSSLFSHMDYVG